MNEYRTGAHTVYQIEYHFVWVTKYRYKVLTGEVGPRARDIIRQSCLAREIKIIKGHVSADHVHLLVSCPPKLSPSKVMQYLKKRAMLCLNQNSGQQLTLFINGLQHSSPFNRLGCESLTRSWLGVCPKFWIWDSAACRSSSSVILSRSTAPS